RGGPRRGRTFLPGPPGRGYRTPPRGPRSETSMKITEAPQQGYERVVRCEDPESGLRAIIAVHDTRLGPALGGLRMWPFPSWDAATFDVLRLAKGMTYKSAVADTGLGGGK